MIRENRLKTLIIRKLSVIIVVFVFTLVSLYFKDSLPSVNRAKLTASSADNHLDSSIIAETEDNQDETEPFPAIEYNQLDQSLLFNTLRIRSILAAKDESDSKKNSKSSSSSSQSSSSSSSPPSIEKPFNAVKDGSKKEGKTSEPPSKTPLESSTQNAPVKEIPKLGKENGDKKATKGSDQSKSGTPSSEVKGKGSATETKNATTAEHSNTTKPHLKHPKTPIIPILKNEKIRECTPPAYKEFPNDIFGHRARSRGAVIVHIAVACYMFYCLAIVCDHYFLTSLQECSLRLGLSDDVAGATLMAAGSSAPELFTAILGVFVAKGDVGTGTIVGSAVFNILFVIGLCALLAVETPLSWWPVARDSTYYTFTVLILILVAYDGEVNKYESALMLVLYVVYIVVMNYNLLLRDLVVAKLNAYIGPVAEEIDATKANNQVVYYHSMQDGHFNPHGLPPSLDPNRTSLYEAANFVIIKHRRLFPAISRFRAAARLIMIKIEKRRPTGTKKQRPQDFNCKNKRNDPSDKLSKSTQSPNIEQWSYVPNPVVEGWWPVVQWCTYAPLHAALFYTIPSCKARPNLFLVTFFMSVFWIALFSYIMVWMVTLVGYTFGIPDSIMGITFLAAGTSIPDAYSSIHVARMGQGDMAVSNSIGSNVFDILVGLALPWFVETTMWEPGTVATINSRGLFYAIILLFLSLVTTIYLFHRSNWTLKPSLGIALLLTYIVFLILCGAMELNLFGYVNPVMCEE